MEKKLIIVSILILTLVALSSCSPGPVGPSEGPGDDPAAGEAVSNCNGLIGSYETAGPRPLEEAPPGEPFSAWLLAFTPDGTVLWKYTPEVVSGTFTCKDNQVKASFSEGTRTGFEGVFNPQEQHIAVEELIYYKVTDE